MVCLGDVTFTVVAPGLQELVDYLTQAGATSTHVQPAALELHFAGQAQVCGTAASGAGLTQSS